MFFSYFSFLKPKSAAQAADFVVYEGFFCIYIIRCTKDGSKMYQRSDHLLLDLLQIFRYSASRIRPSRKEGWAREMIPSALSQVDRPSRLITPYSVAIKYTWLLGEVIISPLNWGTTLEESLPCRSRKVEFMHRKAFPPLEAEAPIRKSSWPPVPLICLDPKLSEET